MTSNYAMQCVETLTLKIQYTNGDEEVMNSFIGLKNWCKGETVIG